MNQRYSISVFYIFIILVVFIQACSTVPVTGRRQLSLIPDSQLLAMSYQEYDNFLKSHKLSNNQAQTQTVKTVGVNIQKAVERFFTERNMADELKNYRWEFNLVESKDVNAWCMPGGKVVFYTGILPITQNDDGIAVVMGHEIAHAIGHHGRERMSQALIAQLGGLALAQAVKDEPAKTKAMWMTAYNVGAGLGVILPYSRLQESEADRLGLIFMAMAGYNPETAVSFWERMASKKGGQSPPEFLSTHPSDKTRIRKIKELLPEAMEYYKP